MDQLVSIFSLTLCNMRTPLTIYRASAGSGKTFTLTAEYVALLLATPSSREAEHILAVTFTNKATAEMKDRILNALYILAHDLKGSQEMMNKVRECLKENGSVPEHAILRQRAKAALSSILHDYNRFRVETIDSFFQSILHTLTRELGLTSGMRIELNSQQVIDRAVERIMEHLGEREQVKQWILDYVREQIEESERWDISNGMKSLGNHIYEDAYQKQHESETSINKVEQAKALKQILRKLKRDTEEEIRSRSQDVLLFVEQSKLTWDDISYGRSCIENTLLKASKMGLEEKKPSKYELPGVRFTNAMEDPNRLVKGKKNHTEEIMAAAQDISEQMSKWYACYREGLQRLNSISLTLKYLSPLCLMETIEEEATNVCSENGQFLLSRTPVLLSKMVEGSDAPFILERAGTQFHHVMIDEFQDTSRMQWANFRNLLIENLASGGHSLLVGDVKQSIYRWRGGDWEILQGAYQELRHLQPEQTTLEWNWRSCPTVVNFNNAFFAEAAQILDSQATDARFRLADIYSDVAQRCARDSGAEGYVDITLFKKDGQRYCDNYEERTVEEMTEQIRKLKKLGVAEKDMAILVRRNATAAQLLALFHTHAPDISLVSDEAFLLEASVAVQMLVAAMQVIADGTDKTNPVTLKFLTLHYQREIMGCEADTDQLMRKDPAEVLPDEILSRRESLARMPLLLLAERLYHLLHLERIEGQDAYMLAFMDELQAYLRDNPQDIHQFLRAWQDSISRRPIPSGETGGIRILTIHKSKGLEYHTVLLPFMDWNLRPDAIHEQLLWCRTDEEPYCQIGALPIALSSKMENSVFGADYKEEVLQQRVDTLNMIYVAFTRARCNLLIWGAASANGKLTCVGDIISHAIQMNEEEESELRYRKGTLCGTENKGKQEKKAAKDNCTDKTMRMNMPLTQENAIDTVMSTRPPTMQFMQSEQARLYMHSIDDEAEERKQEDTYIESGKLMHYALSLIGEGSEATTILDRLEAEGYADHSEAWQKARQAIERGLHHPTIARWFAPGKRFLRECGIITRDALTGQARVKRPDRVVMEEGLITVIDYKFGRRKSEYQEQVREYMRQISAMYPHCRVEGWLWYVYSTQTEQITL